MTDWRHRQSCRKTGMLGRRDLFSTYLKSPPMHQNWSIAIKVQWSRLPFWINLFLLLSCMLRTKILESKLFEKNMSIPLPKWAPVWKPTNTSHWRKRIWEKTSFGHLPQQLATSYVSASLSHSVLKGRWVGLHQSEEQEGLSWPLKVSHNFLISSPVLQQSCTGRLNFILAASLCLSHVPVWPMINSEAQSNSGGLVKVSERIPSGLHCQCPNHLWLLVLFAFRFACRMESTLAVRLSSAQSRRSLSWLFILHLIPAYRNLVNSFRVSPVLMLISKATIPWRRCDRGELKHTS